MTAAECIKQTEHKMGVTVEKLREDFSRIRTGRPSTGLLDKVKVDYYGCPTPINQIAQVGVGDAHTLTVQPWEKNMVKAIEKAIRDSDLGLNPATSGDTIRVPLPPLTEERRRELTKVVKGFGEDAKVAVRNLRRDANSTLERLEKDKEISEDDQRRFETEVQKLTDRYVGEIDKVIEEKEKEIMTV
ncbi:ribosome recycling factor [Sutterella sp.]|uniref:ribosome recycling factor n=1 Tax=Sutterella sp. TaxID=1981025 RepID=UPI0026DF769A|nr:ribosome recycling factor [Sutterella sp.]MDO5530867.1 ribosome recycling factor [Sutterella sp.]